MDGIVTRSRTLSEPQTSDQNLPNPSLFRFGSTSLLVNTWSRDHCILGQTFDKLSPPFLMHLITEYFFCIIQMIQLWHYWEIVCPTSINNIFFLCYKKHLKWGDDAKKKVSPIIKCSMLEAWSSLDKGESLAGLPDNFPIQQKDWLFWKVTILILS